VQQVTDAGEGRAPWIHQAGLIREKNSDEFALIDNPLSSERTKS
jgi:hypothetical protein